MKKAIVVFLLLGAVGCAAKVEKTMPAPAIPEVSKVTSELHGVSVTILPFVDARLPAIQEASTSNKSITQPDEGVTTGVEDAFRKALASQGVTIDSGGNKQITAEIRRWDSIISAAASGSLESHATLYLEVKDTQGTSVFSGEYNGSRSSTFPVIAKQDVGDSLGLAMSEAIEQAVRDSNLRRYLR